MPRLRSTAWLTLTAATIGCAHRVVDSEQRLRGELQVAHEATLRLEIRGRLAATRALGFTSVTCWWREDVPPVTGTVDAAGKVRVMVPAIDVRYQAGPIPTTLHFVDRAGAHWYCTFDLQAAPPLGAFDLGELALAREPDAPTVVDGSGRPVAGAHFILDGVGTDRGYRQGVTDATGRIPLCRAVPIEPPLRLIVRHQDYAPWCGELEPRIELSRAADVRGRVVLPRNVDPADLMACVWIEEASLPHVQGDEVYARITAPIARDGSYHLHNVPSGRRSIGVVNRLTSSSLGPRADVDVTAADSTAPDLSVSGSAETTVRMQLRLVDNHGRPVRGDNATINVSDVGVQRPLRGGQLEWVGVPTEPFGIEVDGYVEDPRRLHRTGETIRLRGGHQVSVRLALNSARHLPPGCALWVSIRGAGVNGGSRLGTALPLAIDRDTEFLVTEPGRYQIELDLERWDAGWRRFRTVGVDVAPSRVELLGDTAAVTVASRFIEKS